MRGLLPISVLTLLTACGGVEMGRGDLSSMYGRPQTTKPR